MTQIKKWSSSSKAMSADFGYSNGEELQADCLKGDNGKLGEWRRTYQLLRAQADGGTYIRHYQSCFEIHPTFPFKG
ncbi:MAG: hypothetical protein ACE5H7_04390 [Acidiferrobacterales bacterium]